MSRVSLCMADECSDNNKTFEDAGASNLFNSAYGYALFPTIGKVGFVVGGSYGKGCVYEQGKYIEDTSMKHANFIITKGGLMYEASVGWQKFSFTRR